jgi:peptide/nickel transport system substrate-binding protein
LFRSVRHPSIIAPNTAQRQTPLTECLHPELEKMYEQQSIEPDETKRKKLVWEIDRRLQEEAARPMIFNYRPGTCRSPAVHGITIMVYSLFNGWRFEDAWLGQ